jgi:hypothetical protein
MSHDPNRRDHPQNDRPAHESTTASADDDGSTASQLHDLAARRLGFLSYDALVRASTPITARDGRIHLIVEGPDGRWLVWREESWPEYRTFDSIHHAGRAAGEAES